VIDLRKCVFEDHPGNPVVTPPGREFIIADPTVITPADSPDEKWHMYAHALKGIHHYRSEDGLKWDHVEGPLFVGLRPFLFVEDGYHLFYERFERPWRTVVAVRSSRDLETWSEPRTLVAPRYAWEGKGLKTNSNPCVVKHDGGYRLYYDAGWVWLPDCFYIEPRHLAVCESDLLLGPYQKQPEPILSPDPAVPYRNQGVGALRAYPPEGKRPWLALHNNMFVDKEGHSRSDVRLYESEDGLTWSPTSDKPILAPEPGWKKAFVYAVFAVEWEGRAYLYYNARDGWFRGTERIGVAISS
jgi:hypothetical protein